MMNQDEAYEIIITPIISHDSIDRMRKVEAIQTRSMTFFRYIYSALYHGYDAIIDEKFFLNEEEAILYWNREVAHLCVMTTMPSIASATA